jgi:hypothetical protein
MAYTVDRLVKQESDVDQAMIKSEKSTGKSGGRVFTVDWMGAIKGAFSSFLPLFSSVIEAQNVIKSLSDQKSMVEMEVIINSSIDPMVGSESPTIEFNQGILAGHSEKTS